MILDKVTLVAVSSIKINETIQALENSMKGVEYAEVLLISHEQPINLPNNIKFKKCRRLNSIDAYNWFMIFELAKYVETEFALVVQHDGYVLNPDKWTDDFLNYDYIGAPWPPQTFFDKTGQEIRVGNGGFSLRSKKLLSVFNDLDLPFDNDVTSFPSEDAVICVYHRSALENYGIKFAPVALASAFSREFNCNDSSQKTFGFHFHPTSHFIKSKNTRNSLKEVFKMWIKKIIPRVVINKGKALFLENVRRGIDINKI
jgi:hypothetical protein